MLINAFLVQDRNEIFAYNDYLKECGYKSSDIKGMGICTKILGDSKRISDVFDGDELNVCGATFILEDCWKVNERFPMADKIVHVQNMCNYCSSAYYL